MKIRKIIESVSKRAELLVYQYAQEVREDVEGKHPNTPKKRINKKEYPACVVACYSKAGNHHVECGKSGVKDNNPYSSPVLIKALNKIGGIGKYSSLCDNKIGSCAEPHAAEKILLQIPMTNLSTLYFCVKPSTILFLCCHIRIIRSFVTPTYKVPFFLLNRIYT